MKTTQKSRYSELPLVWVLVAVMAWCGAGVSFADNHHDAWSHDKSGYWDNHGRHQSFVEHNNHHGYWRTRDDGVRLFINVD